MRLGYKQGGGKMKKSHVLDKFNMFGNMECAKDIYSELVQ